MHRREALNGETAVWMAAEKEEDESISGSVMKCWCYLHSVENLYVAVHSSQSLIVTRLRKNALSFFP